MDPVSGEHVAASGPPWYRVVSKALAALVAALVVNSAIVYAAVQDGHVTTSETVTIVFAVLGTLAVPGAVYAAPKNATKPGDPPPPPPA